MAVQLQEFLDHVNAGRLIEGGSAAHAFMHEASQEALRTLAELNGAYRSPDEVRALLSRLTGREVAESVTVFPPFYSEFGKNLTLGEGVFINMGCRFQDTGGISIGDGSLIGHGSTLTTLNHSMDPARRADMILADAKNLAFAQGYELVEDEGLLAEVAGLVEWPVTLMGTFDKSFLSIPDEVIRATIRNNQKCFVLRDPQTAKLANKFILVANEEAADGGQAIVAGNERVIRARLSDAKFFYETDLKTRLEDRLPKFEHIVFHEKLGTQAARIARIRALAGQLAPNVDADAAKSERAADLCKADLLTDVVGEFPDLQGLMGRYYAEAQNEDEAVAHACEDHYKPKGPDDLVPAEPVSVAVALADKIDTLTGFWAIDEKPTGSKDPYALRRAALGVIRLVIDNKLRLPLKSVFQKAVKNFTAGDDLLSFFADRLKVQLREQGARHDLVDAVFSLPGQDDLLLVVRRVEALGKFLDSDDGKNLLAGYKRATNIIRIEEKKDKREYVGAPDSKKYQLSEEKALAEAIDVAKKEASASVAKEDFAAAMRAMAKLRPRVDAFFDKVTVNVDDKALRENRLKLLNEIREATRSVADFSKIEG